MSQSQSSLFGWKPNNIWEPHTHVIGELFANREVDRFRQTDESSDHLGYEEIR